MVSDVLYSFIHTPCSFCVCWVGTGGTGRASRFHYSRWASGKQPHLVSIATSASMVGQAELQNAHVIWTYIQGVYLYLCACVVLTVLYWHVVFLQHCWSIVAMETVVKRDLEDVRVHERVFNPCIQVQHAQPWVCLGRERTLECLPVQYYNSCTQ